MISNIFACYFQIVLRGAIIDVKDGLVFASIALKFVGESFGLFGKWGDLEKE